MLPAPGSSIPDDRPTITLQVRNLALAVAHDVPVPADADGPELEERVRTALALPNEQSSFDGRIGLRFHYQLMIDGSPVSDQPLAEQRITEYRTLDLRIEVEQFGPDGSTGRTVFRNGGNTTHSQALVRTLIRSAFGHLMPLPPGGPAPR